MADEVSRSAAKLAALVAVPVALLAGAGVFALLNGAFRGDSPDALPAPPASSPATPTGPAPTTPVELAAPPLTPREQVVCRALLSQLPDTIRDLAPRPVTAGPEQNAAFGDPPITVECGVPPAEYPPTDQLYPTDGLVCWHATQRPDQTEWVTVDREVPVRVTVPAAYEGPGQWAAEFSPTIVETIRSLDTIPSGC